MIDAAILAALWALAATCVAFLPMRLQMVPGLILLAMAPVLIGFVWFQHGIWFGLAATFGFLSMFRRPLLFLTRRLCLRICGPSQ